MFLVFNLRILVSTFVLQKILLVVWRQVLLYESMHHHVLQNIQKINELRLENLLFLNARRLVSHILVFFGAKKAMKWYFYNNCIKELFNKKTFKLFAYFEGRMVANNRIQVTKEGRLIIDDVRLVDQGNYVCAAVNSVGSTLAKASLNVVSGSKFFLFATKVFKYKY